jgi:hypothetical protein
MAIILSPGTRVCDASGNPVSGGKVRVYNADTTTLSSLYSDEGLTVALSNPVICNSAGYPSTNSGAGSPTLIFAAESTYDVALLDASNNVLASFDDTPSVGSDADVASWDFTASRARVRNSGGVVQWESGSPSPDNTGGYGRAGGWDGTQADEYEIDAALVNVTGVLTEADKHLSSLVIIPVTAFSAVSSVEIPLTQYPAGILGWEIDIWDFSKSVQDSLLARLSYDGGGTYKSGASDYRGQVTEAYATNVTNSDDLVGTSIRLATNINSALANAPGTIRIQVITPESGNNFTIVSGRGMNIGAGPKMLRFMFEAWGQGSYGKATHLQILPNSGTITGKYLVRGLRGLA